MPCWFIADSLAFNGEQIPMIARCAGRLARAFYRGFGSAGRRVRVQIAAKGRRAAAKAPDFRAFRRD
jgi:hypothetical protein